MAGIPQRDLYLEDLYLLPEKTTIILSESWNEIGEADRQLLQKILGSVRLSIDAVAILRQPALDLSALTNKPKRVIYFGPAVKGLNQYELLPSEGGFTILSAPLKDSPVRCRREAKIMGRAQAAFSILKGQFLPLF